MSSLSRLEAFFLDVTSDMFNNCSFLNKKQKQKHKKQNLVLVNKDAHQRETIT